jgi:hypothetical protein
VPPVLLIKRIALESGYQATIQTTWRGKNARSTNEKLTREAKTKVYNRMHTSLDNTRHSSSSLAFNGTVTMGHSFHNKNSASYEPILEGVRPFLAFLTIMSMTSAAEKLFFNQLGAERM